MDLARRKKIVYNIIGPDLLEELYEEYPDLRKYSPRTLEKMLYDFNKFTGDKVTSIREGVALGSHIGYLFIGSFAPQAKRNVALSLKMQTFIKEKLLSTDGHWFRILYVNYPLRSRFAAGQFWGFTATVPIRKLAYKRYMEDWKKYIHIPYLKTASTVFRKAITKIFIKNNNKNLIDNHNEFAFD